MKRSFEEFDRLRRGILDIVVDNFDYLKSQSPQLAWAMMNLELLDKVGSELFPYDTMYTSIKDIVTDTGERLPSKEDANLLYDAWSMSIPQNWYEFTDTNPELPLEGKLDKTMPEWVRLFRDSRYRYHDLFPSKFLVYRYLLCVMGSGYSWNGRGFIAPIGPEGTDLTIFSGYTRAEKDVPEEIRTRIVRLRNHPSLGGRTYRHLRKSREVAEKIQYGEKYSDICPSSEDRRQRKLAQKLKREAEEQWGTGELSEEKYRARLFAEVRRLEKELGFEQEPQPRNSLNEYSNLVTMPANAHVSYVRAGLQVARKIITDSREEASSKGYAERFLQSRQL